MNFKCPKKLTEPKVWVYMPPTVGLSQAVWTLSMYYHCDSGIKIRKYWHTHLRVYNGARVYGVEARVYCSVCIVLSAPLLYLGLGRGLGARAWQLFAENIPLHLIWCRYMGTNILRPTCSEHMQSTNVHKYMQLYGLWNTKKVSASIFKW